MASDLLHMRSCRGWIGRPEFFTSIGMALVCVVFAACDTGPPMSAKLIPTQHAVVNIMHELDLRPYFSGSSIDYYAESRDTEIVTVSVSGHTLRITPKSPGWTSIAVRATNHSGWAPGSLTVRVTRFTLCKVGDVLGPGDACSILFATHRNEAVFSVTAKGLAVYSHSEVGMISVGDIDIDRHQFTAIKRGPDTWEITRLP